MTHQNDKLKMLNIHVVKYFFDIQCVNSIRKNHSVKIFNLNKIWADAYLLLKIWILIGSILCAYIICINANRRLNDINGKVSKDTNLIFEK